MVDGFCNKIRLKIFVDNVDPSTVLHKLGFYHKKIENSYKLLPG